MPPRNSQTSASPTPAAKGTSSAALQAALTQIERSFGKGAVMRMGDQPIRDIESIPTGSLGLDLALGIGGLPKGRIIEIYGPESSGKCLAADSLLLSGDGLMSVSEFFDTRGFKATCTTRIVEHEATLVNERGEWENTSHLTWNGKRKVRRMTTSIGNELAPTLRHPLRVMDDNGFIVWKRVEDIEVGDVVPVMRNTEAFPSSDKMTRDEARLLGYLIADGHNAPFNTVSFCNSDDEVVSIYKETLSNLFPQKDFVTYSRETSLTQDHRLFSKEFRSELFERLGLGYDLSADKEVPISVRRSGRGVQLAFLRGYLELECSLDASKRSVEVTSASRRLLQHVQAMLLNMGVVSTLSPKPVNETVYWRLTASGEQGHKLVRMIGFETTARQKSAALFADDTRGGTNIDSIPYQGRLLRSLYLWATEKNEILANMVCDYMGEIPKANLTYHRLGMIVDAFEEACGTGSHTILLHFRNLLDSNYFYAVIEDIREEVEPTFDVSMPKTHSFWSSGLISHNTTLALHVIAEAQKLGGACAFIDAEHALDPGYARKLGVDVDNLFLSQPDNGEQALEITDTLVRSGALSVLVVDSVAALSPRAEIEGEMGDNHVGLHARLMSQALRKLTGNVSRSNTIVIMLNQIRCLHEDTWVWTDIGQIRISETSTDMLLSTPYGMRSIQGVHNAGEVSGIRLIPKFRPSLAVAFGHRQTVLDPGHGLREALADDIRPGWWMAYPCCPETIFPDTVEASILTSEAAFLGMFFADGSCVRSGTRGGRAGTNFVSFTERDPKRRAIVMDGAVEFFSTFPVKQFGERIHIGGTNAIEKLEKFSVYDHNHAKVVPPLIMSGSKQVVREFLRNASFDTHAFGKGGFVWTFETAQQAEDIAVLLLRFGVFADIRNGRRGQRNYLFFSGMDAIAFANNIGFREETKQLASNKFIASQGSRGKFDVVPPDHVAPILKNILDSVNGVSRLPHYANIYMCLHKGLNVSRQRLIEFCMSARKSGCDELDESISLLKGYRFSPVQIISEERFNAFDLEVEGSRFYGNGTLTHNSKIGVMFGSNETTTGGNALKFYASVRLDIRRIGQIKDKDEVVGNQTRVKVIKNKVAPPFKQTEFDILYGQGISKSGEVLDMAVKAGIVDKAGAWFSYDSVRIGQGRDNSRNWLDEHIEVRNAIEARLRGMQNLSVDVAPADREDVEMGEEDIED